MMHDQEKSDLSTVAVKSANKGGKPSAESMERREGAEGNAVESRTRRTPSRESVFQGLDRVRQAAKAKKKESSPLYFTTWTTNCLEQHFPG
jgi:hypothetical protein